MSRAIVAIMVLAIIAVGAVFVFQGAIDDAGSDTDINAESFTPSAGSVTQLDHSNLDHTQYDATVDVRDGNGNKMDAERDYIWFADNGTIKTVTGGDLDGDNSAEIDYGYQTTTTEQRQLSRIVAIIPNAAGVLLPLLGIAMIFIILRG